MSTILKALHRLEEEKSARADRSLREQVAAAPPASRGVPLGLAVGGGVVAGIAVGVALLMLWGGGDGPTEGAASPPVAAAPRPPVPPPSVPRAAAASPEPAAAAELEPPPVPEFARPSFPAPTSPTRELAALLDPEELTALAEAGKIELPVDLARAPAAAPVSAPPVEDVTPPVERAPALPGAALRSPVEVVERTRPAPSPIPTPEPVQRAAAEPPRRVSPAPPPPARRAPPAEVPDVAIVRSPVPEVFVQRTVWHPLPERRHALVELPGESQPRRVREGDEIGSLRVSKIDPSAVVFVHESVEHRRRVGAR